MDTGRKTTWKDTGQHYLRALSGGNDAIDARQSDINWFFDQDVLAGLRSGNRNLCVGATRCTNSHYIDIVPLDCRSVISEPNGAISICQGPSCCLRVRTNDTDPCVGNVLNRLGMNLTNVA